MAAKYWHIVVRYPHEPTFIGTLGHFNTKEEAEDYKKLAHHSGVITIEQSEELDKLVE